MGKGAPRRAHHLSADFILNGGHASLCPPYFFSVRHAITSPSANNAAASKNGAPGIFTGA
jgi:hypothetical protein